MIEDELLMGSKVIQLGCFIRKAQILVTETTLMQMKTGFLPWSTRMSACTSSSCWAARLKWLPHVEVDPDDEVARG
jgi:hypothetical protein